MTFTDSYRRVIGNGMTALPFGTTLVAATAIIGGVLNKKKLPGFIQDLEWQGMSIRDCDDLQAVQQRDEVVVLLRTE